MSQGKSPYELRADLLKLAFQILQAKHSAQSVADGKEMVSTSPTTEEVIEEARKLNDFISKQGNMGFSGKEYNAR
jgi:hypothetical protein